MPRIGLRDIENLKEWEGNYRQGDVETILASILKFGFNGALRVWTGEKVIAGNHALKALLRAKEIGAEPPVGVTKKGEKWFVPCIDVSHLSEAESIAFAVADNRTSDLAENNEDILGRLLQQIESDGLLDDVGYGHEDLQAMLASMTAPEVSPPVFEPTSEPPVKEPRAATCPECGHTFTI